MHNMRLILAAALLTLLALTGLPQAEAGSVIFPADDDAFVQRDRVIVEIHGDGTISTTISAEYTAFTGDFAWVLPVPTAPIRVENLADNIGDVNALDTLTAPRFEQPVNYCAAVLDENPDDMIDAAVGEAVDFPNPGDYVTFGADQAGDLPTWLAERGLTFTEDAAALIADYAAEGWTFVGFGIDQEGRRGQIGPVRVTYEAEAPVIPLRLSTYHGASDYLLTAWVLADQPWLPENSQQAEIDFGTLLGLHEFIERGFPGESDQTQHAYRRALRDLGQGCEGSCYVVEYNGPTAIDPEFAEGNNFAERLLAGYESMTRISAVARAYQPAPDLTFAPAPDAPQVTRQIDLTANADPLEYWGCTTLRLQHAEDELRFDRFLYTADGVHVGVPEGWSATELDAPGGTITVLSPSFYVTLGMVTAFFNATYSPLPPPPPMVVITQGEWESREENLRRVLGLSAGAVINPDWAVRWDGFTRPALGMQLSTNAGVHVNLLAAEADWDDEAFRFAYGDLRRYIESYAYAAGRGLRHTLALGSDLNYYNPQALVPWVVMGFPAGWAPRTIDETRFLLRPAEQIDDDDAPTLALIRTGVFAPGVYELGSEALIEALIDVYEFDAEAADALWAAYEDRVSTACTFLTGDSPLHFVAAGREGYIGLAGPWLVETSAPEGSASALLADLRAAAASIHFPPVGCG
jgi:hypothetical protein